MKQQSPEMTPNRPRDAVRRHFKFGLALAQAVLLGLGAAVTTSQAEEAAVDDQGAQVLTRGPVHEAFAGIVSYNPEPGVIVEKAPPEAIDELPPEERPAGDNITWIPGYWAWDDERGDYLWISGTWRALPPGRQWTTGYWGTTGQGHQWTSGYWADSSVQEITYLPKPPVTVEVGPNVEAPSRDHSWTPGSWMWNQERYAWRPGYWAEGRSNWDWIPAHYVWTPRGYVFVDGYWDYNFSRRGVLYAPVYFQSGYHSRPGYQYSPVIAIGLVALMEHLFLRPNYHHYYFGDYYDRSYRDRGYYSPYAYQSSRYGYDPVYSYRRWTHRQDRDWERRYEASYDYRREHESARPPRSWADQKRLKFDNAESKEHRLMMAAPLDQMAKNEDSPISVRKVPAKERQELADVGQEVRKNRDQRRTLETEGANTASGKADREIKPTKAKLPASPIVGKSADDFPKSQAPPKPRRTQSVESKKESPDRQSGSEKTKPETKRQPESSESGKTKESEPKAKKDQSAPNRAEENLQKTPRQEPQAKEPKRETRQEPQAKEPKRETRQEPQAKEPKRETRQEPQAKEPKRETRQEPQAKEPKRETRQEPQAREPKRETRQEPQAKEPKRETRQEPQAREPKRETRKESVRPEKTAPREQPKESGNREQKTANPPSGKSGSDEEDTGKSGGKANKKER